MKFCGLLLCYDEKVNDDDIKLRQAFWSSHKFVNEENFCYFSKYVIFVQKTNFSLKIFMSKLFKIIYMTFMSLRYVTNEKVLSPPTCIKYKLH